MFLPKYLKEYNNKMKVGWFLHTPFPSSEIHRMLPSRSELLRSVLAADLVGFHTYDYARHFVSACTRILGLEGTPEGVEDQGKLTRVAADRSLDFHALCALYAITDVALVTSLRDGMNLVSYEFVACQASNKGVLILSEKRRGQRVKLEAFLSLLRLS
ncbi:alpha,alpha-trehalose-phosphate synthase [UDP-forming] 1-like [Corylus avellana]|uniref:alpha,alpha-trehalose-phosphate synthase [UDP-forming] 1-like n=1 Tax=Corylus avellana TaxID=13451 RepID=UPI00286D62C9|nr:alpha,alpha-trehalose-phosphate synthase [UDP-forming] 1-like [Corylus avellana]